MVKAYVLIEMVAGHSRSLVDNLMERQVVKYADRVTGPYDVVAILEASDINNISEVVTNEIHSRAGVVRTTTCVSLE